MQLSCNEMVMASHLAVFLSDANAGNGAVVTQPCPVKCARIYATSNKKECNDN
jgi:hypothetical protein